MYILTLKINLCTSYILYLQDHTCLLFELVIYAHSGPVGTMSYISNSTRNINYSVYMMSIKSIVEWHCDMHV